jgi:ABC-type nitrate/sulfonate/bicarbonate transport system permease component
MALRRRLVLFGVEVGATVGIVAILWGITRQSHSPFVPPLSNILSEFRKTWLFSHVRSDLVPSLERLGVGYAIAVIVGAGLGFVFGTTRLARLMFRPVTVFFRSVPPIGLLPVAIALFGTGDHEKYFVIAFTCVWPILLNTEDGVADIDPTIKDSARAYGVTGPRYFVDVLLPATLPRIFAGMRTSLAFAVLLLVVAELVGSTNGIGYTLLIATNSYEMSKMWASVLLLGALGYTLNLLLVTVERRTIRWHHARRALAE